MKIFTIIAASILTTQVICSNTTWNKHLFGPILLGTFTAYTALLKRS